jgi:outer membrane protein assembly factor BamB
MRFAQLGSNVGSRARAVAVFVVLSLALAGPLSGSSPAELANTSGGRWVAPASSSWPSWRYDSGRTGFNAGETTLQPPLKLLWKRDDSRAAELSAADGLVFNIADEGAGRLRALDASNGSVRWIDPQSKGSFITPAVEGGRVFASDFLDGPRALSAQTGDLLWARTDLLAGELGLVAGEVTNGLWGLSPASGETLWTTLWQCTGGGGEPYAFLGRTIYASGFGAVTACDIGATTEKWIAHDLPGRVGWPVVADGRVFLAWSIDVQAGRGGIYSLDPASGGGTKVFSMNSRIDVSTSPAVGYGKVYFGGEDGIMRALDAGSLQLVWQTTLLGAVRSSPAVGNGVVYVTTVYENAAHLYALDTDTGKLLWSYVLPESARTTSPILADGRLYVIAGLGCGRCTLYAFEASSTAGQAQVELDYFALGDSIASGHGLLDSGLPCRRSPRAYPAGVAELLKRRYKRVTFHFRACSGATVGSPGAVGYRSFDNQVKFTLSRLSKRSALVSITVGVDDFKWADPRTFYRRLYVDQQRPFENWVATLVEQVKRNLMLEIRRLLLRQNVVVVLTDYPNPINRRSRFFSMIGGETPRCGFARDCYARTEFLVHRLNTALGEIFRDLGRPARMRLVSVHGTFHGHESPKPSCGAAAPDVAVTWIQYRDDPNSNSLPRLPGSWRGDCFHPNARGASAIAGAVSRALSVLDRKRNWSGRNRYATAPAGPSGVKRSRTLR